MDCHLDFISKRIFLAYRKAHPREQHIYPQRTWACPVGTAKNAAVCSCVLVCDRETSHKTVINTREMPPKAAC